jgi:hypothetical protein
VFVQETVCCWMSDIGFVFIDYCKEESRLVFTIRKVFVLPAFILELVLVVHLSTEWFRKCVSFLVFWEGKSKNDHTWL